MLKKAMRAFMRQASPPEVNAILLDLSGYTLAHFREEEELMRSYGFPKLKAHKEEHDRMAGNIRGLLDIRCKQEALRSAASALDLWLEAHIRVHDTEFRDFIQPNKV
jgi:hemerythrin-like metal-binding protein